MISMGYALVTCSYMFGTINVIFHEWRDELTRESTYKPCFQKGGNDMKKVRISKEAAFIKKAAESGSFSILNPDRILTISAKRARKSPPAKELDEAAREIG
jgi:hypothetical protein